MSEMVPKVTVPMNFGREHIGSPSHDNLALKLKDGVELKANSLILSFNSPVIAHLTSVLYQTSLDMDDFSEDAVNCFIDAAYSGELAQVSGDNFRDVNKMAHVFDVKWLSGKCEEYFNKIVKDLTGDDYLETFFTLDEATYCQKTTKSTVFLSTVIQKISSFTGSQKEAFVEKYANGTFKFSELDTDQLDFLLKISGDDVAILVKFLKNYLPNLTSGLDKSTLYLLENMDLVSRNVEEGKFVDELIDMIQEVKGISVDHMKLGFQLYRNNTYRNNTITLIPTEKTELATPPTQSERYHFSRASGSIVMTVNMTFFKTNKIKDQLSDPVYLRDKPWYVPV